MVSYQAPAPAGTRSSVTQAGPALFEGRGEMAALMREKDWSATPLGPPDHWPQSLRAVVRILLTSRFAMWMGWGPELTFLYNDAYAEMTLGAKHPWALGRPSHEVWAEVWSAAGPRIEKVLTTGEATWDERLLLFLERSGYTEETYHTFSYSPIADDDGRIRGHLCVVTEETARVIDERRLALLKELGANLGLAKTESEVFRACERTLDTDPRPLPFTLSYLIDPGGTARLVSHSGLPPSRLSQVQALGQEMASRWGKLPDDGWDSAVVLPAAAFMDWPARPWDKPSSEMFVAPIRQSGQDALAGVFVAGANPYRRADEKYRSFVNLFVGQLTAALATARVYQEERRRAEALAELDRAKTVFFSNVSHEFRTPLSLMLGPTEDALRSGERALAGEDLETVYRNQVRLLKLVNTLLDFSRIEAGRMKALFEPVDLAQLTADLASQFRSSIERGGLQLHVDCPALPEPVYVDRSMWEKVVLNLLSNAFKFTLAGRIHVVLRLDAGEAVLRVSDTGVGMPPHELPRVFERFHRVEGTRARTHEGSGIGLALVHDLVVLHGGTIAVDSELGQGTTFTVRLPLGTGHFDDRVSTGSVEATSAARSAVATYVAEAERWLAPGTSSAAAGTQASDTGLPAVAPAHPEQTVLVADDNADMREYVARLLRPFWTVETAANGDDALAAIRNRRPDLLLTDIMMPGLDGFGLLRAVREHPSTIHMPVIMLSARAGDEARVEGLEAGVDDYLVKPFSARELIARVATHLGLGRSRQRLAEHAAELELARDRLEEATRAKDEFLAMLGHELRNPLAPILTALQLMQLKSAGTVEKERTIIERQTRHLVRLVDDLLDVSRIARGKFELRKERIETGTVVTRAIELASPLFESRGQRLDVEVPTAGLQVHADASRLAQALANLLTNAAKYTEPTGHIAITARREGPDVTIVVRDDGIGIEPHMLPRIFDLFVQERQALDRSQGGLGLGLAIVRSIMSLHGGSVTAASDGTGKGSEFVLKLPLAVADSRVVDAPGGAHPPLETPGTGIEVLIVDDNEDASALLAEALELKGHRVQLAADGIAALQLLSSYAPDVALLDIGLPGMDGFELAARLRNDPRLSDLRLVAVTGYGQRADVSRTRDAGFDAHLVKPVDTNELDKVLRELTAPE